MAKTLKQKNRCHELLAGLCLIFSLTACDKFVSPQAEETLFVPPTQAIIPVQQPQPTIMSISPVAVPTVSEDCSNLLAYLQDLTIPDGSIFAPGEKVDKRWLVENQGTCNWDNRYSLRLTGGEPMGAKTELSLVPAIAGNQATIRIDFIAPVERGQYRSAWQAHTPDGKAFGDPIFVEIEVIPRVVPTPVQ